MIRRSVVPIGLLILALMVAGCVMPDRDEPSAAAVATPASPPTVLVTTDSNVRAGPGIDHAARFWLSSNTEVAVTGRNADGTWLRIEHEDRAGWIFAALTDIEAEALASLSDTMPEEMMAAEPAAPTPVPQAVAAPEPTVEPTPEPEPPLASTPAVQPTVTVTGTVVNLRQGPGTDHPTHGQVRSGNQLQVTGRNADGSWLRVVHPAATDGQVWIYGPLTDLDAATVKMLAEVAMVEIDVATPPTPEPESVPELVAEPKPAQQQAAPTVPVDCARRHTVNPNETHLKLITDWFGLDLAATAALNGISPDTPLIAGMEICLSDTTPAQQQAQQPAPAPEQAPEFSLPHPELPVNPISFDTDRFLACAVHPNGTLGCWGNNNHGQASPPTGRFHTVRSGEDFACALRLDNTIACWGSNYYDQVTVPSGSFRSISAGHAHSCALRVDNTIICWGLDTHGETSAPSGTFQAVSAGNTYTCALEIDGAIACWGSRENVSRNPPAGSFAVLAAGQYQACALRVDGTMACWGDNAEGQSSPPPGRWRAVASGLYNTCGVRSDGAMLCWGSLW